MNDVQFANLVLRLRRAEARKHLSPKDEAAWIEAHREHSDALRERQEERYRQFLAGADPYPVVQFERAADVQRRMQS